MSEPDPMPHRTADELMRAADERLEAAERLPEQVAAITGWATNKARTVCVTVDSHGALVGLELTESARRLGQEGLAREIVALAGQAHETTLAQSVGTLSHALGDAATLDLAVQLGLDELIEPDAPVVPLPQDTERAPAVAAGQDSHDDIQAVDFSQYRSDR